MKYVLALFISFSLLAQEAVVLRKDDPAPFDGVLSDSKQMQKYRKVSEENKLLEIENVKLKDLAAVQDQRASIYKEEISLVKDDLRSLEKKTFWTNLGYFTLGVVVTGLAAKAAIESTR